MPKIPKTSENGQKIDICDCNTPEMRFYNDKLYVRGGRRSKNSIETKFEILAKKNLKSVACII